MEIPSPIYLNVCMCACVYTYEYDVQIKAMYQLVVIITVKVESVCFVDCLCSCMNKFSLNFLIHLYAHSFPLTHTSTTYDLVLTFVLLLLTAK